MKKRRKRGTSLDAEIKAQAKKIYESGMASAYQAAVLTIVGKKLDDITAILRAAGIQGTVGSGVYAQVSARPVERPHVPDGPACAQCGRPAVRRAKPNRFTVGEPAWYCTIHQALAGKIEAEDRLDTALIGAQPALPKAKPIMAAPPAQMVEQPIETPTAAESEDGLMAALGMAVGEVTLDGA